MKIQKIQNSFLISRVKYYAMQFLQLDHVILWRFDRPEFEFDANPEINL